MTDPKPIREQVAELLDPVMWKLRDKNVNDVMSPYWGDDLLASSLGLADRILALVSPEPQGDDLWDDDKPLPEDAAIEAANPLETGNHDRWQNAMRLVGARHSKGGLVDLVNWLLSERDEALRVIDRLTSDEAVEAAAEENWETSRGYDYRGHWKHDISPEKRAIANIGARAAITAALAAARGTG